MASHANTAGLSTPPSPDRVSLKGQAVPGGDQEITVKAGSSPDFAAPGGAEEITTVAPKSDDFSRPGGIGQEI